MRDYKKLIDTLNEWGYEISDNQLSQFDRYYELLVEWNEKMNLTAITEFNDVIEKHFLDSISIVREVDMSNFNSMIDIGTGAGFPGIPLKILFPEINVTLLDSLNKRLVFLNEVIDQLKLDNIETVHGRAEDLGRDKNYREQYDLCVSRAVANLSTLTELCVPFVRVGGYFISYKGSQGISEVASAKSAIHLLGGVLEKTSELKLFDNDRVFVIINKKDGTSKKYPRKAGVPGKDPL